MLSRIIAVILLLIILLQIIQVKMKITKYIPYSTVEKYGSLLGSSLSMLSLGQMIAVCLVFFVINNHDERDLPKCVTKSKWSIVNSFDYFLFDDNILEKVYFLREIIQLETHCMELIT